MKTIDELMAKAYKTYLLECSENEQQMNTLSKEQLIHIIKLLKQQ
tara:strand:+ start:558 stop:692 length:135 start_codon:yes stop_codon:yes gene_type:complete